MTDHASVSLLLMYRCTATLILNLFIHCGSPPSYRIPLSYPPLID